MKEQIYTATKGMAMGIAEVIPGVSGGTIAFITGIYQRLLAAINSINFSLIGIYKKDGFKGVWQAIDGTFLISLFIGMGLGIVGGIFAVAKLLETHPEPLWGFFFGLILASVIVLRKEITNLNINAIIAFILGIVVAVVITSLTPTEGSTSLFYVFICGAIAICALMLPGISGSFMLLILGMYTFIITTLKNVLVFQAMSDIIIIATFALGCLTGVISFSRVLTWLFKKFPQITMATMIGFLVGSVYKIWPWRNITSIADKKTGKITSISDYSIFNSLDKDSYKVLGEKMVLPNDYLMSTPKTLLTLSCIILGFILILMIDKFTDSTKTTK
jgi:putative membrane protein